MDFDLNQEQRMWREVVHDFVANEVKPKAQEVDEKAEFNWDAYHKMAGVGLLGLNVEEAYGGTGVDAVSAAIAIEELGWGCGSMALAIAAHNGLGCAVVSHFGSDELKQRYLEPVTSGNGKLAALALTEPGAGSDLQGGVRTRAELVDNEWVINGSKMWCTNATISEFIVTLARTDPYGGSRSLSLILVPSDSQGLHVGTPEKKMGLKGSPTSAVTYENVRVPADHVLGEPGQGLVQTLTVLDGGRIGIGSLSVGLAQAAYEEAEYGSDRDSRVCFFGRCRPRSCRGGTGNGGESVTFQVTHVSPDFRYR